MLLDARSLPPGHVLRSEVCIAGGGAAGISLALELAAAGRDVLLLESGGFESDRDTQALYEGEMVGAPFRWGNGRRSLEDMRLRWLGGTTNHWTGWCRPLDPWVFERRPWADSPGWPLSAQDMTRWYRRAHELCELGPFDYEPGPWAQRTRSTLIDSAALTTAIFHLSPPTRFGERYRGELISNARITTVIHANVTSIELSPDGRHVDRLAVASLGGPRLSAEARSYALALGGLENPRLLLASSSVRPAGVGNDHDLVGRYFMEHPHLHGVADAVLRTPATQLNLYRRDIHREHASVFGVLTLPPSVAARIGAADVSASLVVSDAADSSSPGDRVTPGSLGGWLALTGEPAVTLADLRVRSEQHPDPESRVTLAPEIDSLGMPKLRLDWRYGRRDRDSIARSLEAMGSALAASGVGRLRIKPEGIERDFGVGGHHMGTTRMAASPRAGVVDRSCRVHRVANLYVAGSSVFPSCGYSNPTLTVVALAARLADHLHRVLP